MGAGPKIQFECSKAVEEEFLKGRKVKEVLAAVDGLKNQTRLDQRFSNAATRPRSRDGLGGAKMEVDTYVYWHHALKEGGQEVWQDPTFLRLMKREGLPIGRPAGTRIQAGSSGEARPPGSTRWRKNYGVLQ